MLVEVKFGRKWMLNGDEELKIALGMGTDRGMGNQKLDKQTL